MATHQAPQVTGQFTGPPGAGHLFLGIVTLLCLLGGVVTGLLAGGSALPAQNSMPTVRLVPPTSSPTPAQYSILLLGVDSLAAQRPDLEGCWVLTFQPGLPQYYLVGFSPLAPVRLPDDTKEYRLEDIYAAGRQIDYSGGSLFTREALQALAPGLCHAQG